ncbi:AraC family transcriptional regulator [Motiliproteus sp. SC1-56]|uniref:AraC family transcriptional regulator n=1 Tax=Motiliproteus sp. SC1-56 TaxID=2799565 RepID=UPI001A90C81D|nr:AraC family transcriptional regulator [Motiliproteus sp. SC1-56]
MSPSFSVPISYVNSLISSIRQQGGNAEAILEAAEIAPEELRGEQFPAERYGRLYQRVMLEMRDESYGLLSGGKVPNGTLRMMCLCILPCQSLGEAIQRCSEFYEICRGPRIKPILEVRGRTAQVRMGPLNEVSEAEYQEVLAASNPTEVRTSLSMWHHFLCWLTGRRVPLAGVHFRFPSPPDLADYEVLFQAPLRFNAEDNLLRFPSEALELPVVQTEEALGGFLKTAPYQLLVQVNGDHSLGSRVRALIGRDFSRELPSAEAVAQSLNMSVTTLRRRLLKEDTSYQKIKDACRKEAAINYLSCPELSNNDIAGLMGFDEASAFFRSFKKWTGMTPGEYRARLQRE